MEKKWRVVGVDPAARDRLAGEIGCSPVLASLLLARGIAVAGEASRFLDPKLTDLHDPFLLPDMDRAAARIEEAVRRAEPIAVCGDYDVDGLTATALLVRFFRLLGREVRTHIPHRIEDGYGLRAAAVERLAGEGIRLIVTVDNGSSSADEIALAASRGIDAIVTDHHQVPPGAPRVPCPLVNPCAPGSTYPFPHLAGVGVAFKLAWAISQRFSRGKKVSPELRDFLLDAMSLAALGTISDVVPLLGENRVLARFGLGVLEKSRHPGLRALAAYPLRGVGERLRAEHVAFRIAPAINASGRLGDADIPLRLLLTESAEEAGSLIAVLDRANGRRQRIEEEIHRAARERALSGIDLAADRAIVLADAGWHPGVIGIVAARLCEEFGRPAILIALDGDRGRGSGRSIAGVNLCEALERCREHLISFGGHARAAGVEVSADRIPDLRRALNAAIPLPATDMVPEVDVEVEVDLRELTPALFREIARLEPHGFGNRTPLFGARAVGIAGAPRAVGASGRHLSFFVKNSNGGSAGPGAWKAIAFGRAEALGTIARPGARIDIAFEPVLSRWGGEERPELNVRELRLSDVSRQ